MLKFLLHACASAALVITPLAAQENVPPPKKSDAGKAMKKPPTPKTLPIPEQQLPETAATHNPAPDTLNTAAPKKAARTTPPSPAQPTTTSPPADPPAEPPADSLAATESTTAILPPATAPNDPSPPAKRKIPTPKNTKNTKNSPPHTLNTSAPAGARTSAPVDARTSAPADAQATTPAVEKQRRLATKEARKLKPAQSASLLELMNTGNAAALEAVPGMDSGRIKALRKARPFAEVPDLMAIPGLDPAAFTAIIKWTKNGMPAPTAAPAP